VTKICWTLLAFNDDYILREVLESVLPFGKVVAAEGPVKYWRDQGCVTSTDQTNTILAEYGINTVRRHDGWAEKDDMARAVSALVPDNTEFVWQLDCDELVDTEDMRRVIRSLDTGQYDSVSFRARSYYGGFARIMSGFEANYDTQRIQRWYPGATWNTHRPPTVLAPDGKPWREHRHLNSDDIGVKFSHYSYVWPTQMQRKAAYYAIMGGNIESYFSNVYLPWVLGDDAQKTYIEFKYEGVHNWLPSRRGPCYTTLPNRAHPALIQSAMPRLKERFERELEPYRVRA